MAEQTEGVQQVTRVMQDPVSLEVTKGQSGKYGYTVKVRGDDDQAIETLRRFMGKVEDEIKSREAQ